MAHPFQPHMLNEIIYNLFFLPLRDSEDMPGFHINNMSCEFVPVMELEFVYAQKPRGFFGLARVFPSTVYFSFNRCKSISLTVFSPNPVISATSLFVYVPYESRHLVYSYSSAVIRCPGAWNATFCILPAPQHGQLKPGAWKPDTA